MLIFLQGFIDHRENFVFNVLVVVSTYGALCVCVFPFICLDFQTNLAACICFRRVSPDRRGGSEGWKGHRRCLQKPSHVSHRCRVQGKKVNLHPTLFFYAWFPAWTKSCFCSFCVWCFWSLGVCCFSCWKLFPKSQSWEELSSDPTRHRYVQIVRKAVWLVCSFRDSI